MNAVLPPHVEAFLAALPDAQQRGRGWLARCPAHDDERPSLSIDIGDQDQILLCCRSARCSSKAICAALKLPANAIFPPRTRSTGTTSRRHSPAGPSDKPKRPPETFETPQHAAAKYAARLQGSVGGIWLYQSVDQEPLMAVIRINPPNGKKEIRQVSYGDGGTWLGCSMPVPRPLYNLPDLGASAPEARVYLVEGEKTCESVRSIGLLATTAPGGAGNGKHCDVTPLAGRDVVLLPDNDDAGEKHMQEMSTILRSLDPPARVWIGRLPDLLPKQDAYDWISRLRDVGRDDESIRESLLSSLQLEDPATHAGDEPDADPPVEDGKFVLDPAAPLQSARAFCRIEMPNLLRINEEWLNYTGSHYEDLEPESVRSRVYSFLDTALELDVPPSPFNPNRSKVTNVVDALTGLTFHGREQFAMPCWLDGKGPPPLQIVACKNGLLHLPTGELLPATPNFLTRSSLSIPYDPGAPRPVLWLKFLNDLWGDDAESIATLGEVMGYLLLPDTSQQKLFFLLGPPRAGKGVILRVLGELIGQRNICSPSLNNLGSTFSLQPFIGKSIAVVADMRIDNKSSQAAIAENLLRISGEDMVTIDRKYLSAWSGKLSVRFLIVSNEVPKIADASGALASRFVPLTLHRSFLGAEDPRLSEKLATELPGILLWAIEGWRRLQKRGHFVVPQASMATAAEIGCRAQPLRQFFAERCEIGPDLQVRKEVMFRAWGTWCDAKGLDAGSPETFSRDLFRFYPTVTASRPRAAGERINVYQGLGILEVERSGQGSGRCGQGSGQGSNTNANPCAPTTGQGGQGEHPQPSHGGAGQQPGRTSNAEGQTVVPAPTGLTTATRRPEDSLPQDPASPANSGRTPDQVPGHPFQAARHAVAADFDESHYDESLRPAWFTERLAKDHQRKDDS